MIAEFAKQFGLTPAQYGAAEKTVTDRKYSVQDGAIKFAPVDHEEEGVTPDQALAGFEQAAKDGILNPDSIPAAREKLTAAKVEYDKLLKAAGPENEIGRASCRERVSSPV